MIHVIHEASHQLFYRKDEEQRSSRLFFIKILYFILFIIYFSNVAENSVTFSLKVESFRRFLKQLRFDELLLKSSGSLTPCRLLHAAQASFQNKTGGVGDGAALKEKVIIEPSLKSCAAVYFNEWTRGLWVNCRSSCCGVSLEETRCNRRPSCLRARRTFPSCFHASSPLRHRRGMKAERGRRRPQTAWLSKFPVILCEVKGQLTASGKRCSGDSRSNGVLCLSLLLREGEGQEPGWVKRSEVN